MEMNKISNLFIAISLFLAVIGLAVWFLPPVFVGKAAIRQVDLSVNGATLTKLQYDTVRSKYANKISNNVLTGVITINELTELKDAVKVQSKLCNGFAVNGVIDWNAIKKILQTNCQ